MSAFNDFLLEGDFSSWRQDPRPLIVHVIYRLDVGGLENGLVNLLNRFGPAYRHAIVSLTDATDFRFRLQRTDIPVFCLHRHAGQDWGLYLKLWRLFRALNPSLVHTRNLATLEAAVPAWLAGVPVRVHGEHGWDVNDLNGSNPRYQTLRKLLRGFVSQFIALSRQIEHYLQQQIGVRPKQIAQIYNGVDSDKFQPQPEQDRLWPAGWVQPDSLVFGTVGRMEAVKDQLTLTNAFIELCRKRPKDAPRLRLALLGEGRLREPCQQLLNEAGLLAQAWLPGNRNDIPQLLAQMDVFVLPSLSEGVPNTVLEAMSCGRPVIATKVGGSAELVLDGQTGFLTPVADPVAMAEVMSRYLDKPQLLEQHGRFGRRQVENNYSLAQMVSQYQALYDRWLQPD